jgi:hypothetical protein
MIRTLSRFSTWASGAAVAAVVLSTVTPAYSAAITGDLNFNGNLVATLSSFDFLPPNTGTGDFTVQNFGNTGFFTTLTSTAGTIKDLNAGIAPADATISLANFLTFTSAPTVSFTLTKLNGGTFGQAGCSASPAAAGQSCTPFAGSPINFFNTSATSSIASFSVEGFFTDSSTGQSFLGTGQFSANFLTQNYQQILAILGTGGSVQTPFTGVFSSVPEPDMLPSVLGLGMVIAGAVTLRRRAVAVK